MKVGSLFRLRIMFNDHDGEPRQNLACDFMSDDEIKFGLHVFNGSRTNSTVSIAHTKNLYNFFRQ